MSQSIISQELHIIESQLDRIADTLMTWAAKASTAPSSVTRKILRENADRVRELARRVSAK